MTVAPDDDVVMHFNPKPTRDLDNSQCHVNVGARGCGIASGMIVHQSNPRSIPLIKLAVLRLRVAQGSVIGSGKTCLLAILPQHHVASDCAMLRHGGRRPLCSNPRHEGGQFQTSPKCPGADEPQPAAHWVQTRPASVSATSVGGRWLLCAMKEPPSGFNRRTLSVVTVSCRTM